MVNRMASTASDMDESNGCTALVCSWWTHCNELTMVVWQSLGKSVKQSRHRRRLRSKWCSQLTTPALVFWARVGGPSSVNRISAIRHVHLFKCVLPMTCDASPSEAINCSAFTAISCSVLATFLATKTPSVGSIIDTASSLKQQIRLT